MGHIVDSALSTLIRGPVISPVTVTAVSSVLPSGAPGDTCGTCKKSPMVPTSTGAALAVGSLPMLPTDPIVLLEVVGRAVVTASASHTISITGPDVLRTHHDVPSIDAMMEDCTDLALMSGHGSGHTGGLMTFPSTPSTTNVAGALTSIRSGPTPGSIVARRSAPSALSSKNRE